MSSNIPHNTSAHQPPDRLLDLLVARATEGLSDTHAAELDRLLAENPGVDPDQFELVAAAAAVAMIQPDVQQQGLPDATRAKLAELAAAQTSAKPASPSLRLSGEGSLPRPQTRRRTSPFPWLVAAAAMLLAAIGWWQASQQTNTRPRTSLAAQFDDFKKSADDAIHWPWAGKEKGYENVKGEVYWSDRLQRGYMLLSGLTPNDPRQKQYQLWIVDPKRDKHPVDGGVFDIASSPVPADRTAAGEVIVPIDCKLKVQSPAAFALTVEQPGGVVVSAGPLVVVAAK